MAWKGLDIPFSGGCQGFSGPLNGPSGPPDSTAKGCLMGSPGARSSEEGSMSRVPLFNSPLLLGFDQLERTLDRLAKNAEGYPPYNIERIGENGLRITLARARLATERLTTQPVQHPPS